MKKVLLIIILMFPLTVWANIVCNDGSVSPSCLDCHTGCCSNHGGCTNNPNSNYDYNKSNNNVKTNKTVDNNSEIIGNIIFWIIIIIAFFSCLSSTSRY